MPRFLLFENDDCLFGRMQPTRTVVRRASFWRVVAYCKGAKFKCIKFTKAHRGVLYVPYRCASSNRSYFSCLTLINLYVHISGGNVCNCTFDNQCMNTCCVFSLKKVPLFSELSYVTFLNSRLNWMCRELFTCRLDTICHPALLLF